jgi:UDP-N-acetylmuramyl pentapeptide phosphotransferase/UDP-N-acetylglucosamine-1-phosphate transferase
MNPDLLPWMIRLLVFSLLCATLVSYLLTPPVMWLGRLFGLMDEPNERRIHSSSIPRCGGLAVFAAFSLTLIFMFQLVGFVELTREARSWAFLILPVSLPLILLGLADDKWELSPVIKLLGQILVSILAWNAGMRIGNILGIGLHPVMDLSVTVLLYVAAINAYNLIDGMDGVATGLAAITGLGLCGLNIVLGNEAMAAVCLALTGACLGFLRYNFHPARVFLGDTGSLYLGFVLMSLTLGSQSRSAAAVLLIVPLLTMGVPLIDTGLAIWRRSVRKAMNPELGGMISKADTDHLHHRLARKGFTQRKVAVLLYAIQAAVFGIGLLWLFLRDFRVAIFAASFFAGSYVVLRYLASLEMSASGKWIVDGIRRPGRAQLYRSAMPFLDILAISLSLIILSGLLAKEYPSLSLRMLIQQAATPVIGCPVILIWALKYYRLQWTRARPLQIFYLAVIVVSGIVLGVSLSPIAQHHTLRQTLLFNQILLSTALPLMIFGRIFPRLVQDFMHYHERKQHAFEGSNLPRVLIYGAGYGYTLIVRSERFTDLDRRKQYKLIGLVDDDPYLRGRDIHGHTVLGSIHDLEKLCISHDIDELLISTTLREDCRAKCMEIAEQLDLKVSKSMFANETLRERLKPEISNPTLSDLNPD